MKKGLLIINRDIKNYEEISGGLPCKVVTFGHSAESDYSAADITYDAFARPTFTLMERGKRQAEPLPLAYRVSTMYTMLWQPLPLRRHWVFRMQPLRTGCCTLPEPTAGSRKRVS